MQLYAITLRGPRGEYRYEVTADGRESAISSARDRMRAEGIQPGALVSLCMLHNYYPENDGA